MLYYRYAMLLAVTLLFSSHYVAGQDLDSLLNLQAFTPESELQKGLNKDVSVSTLKLSSRESPGIITVITKEEISNSGARDLTDVLRLVPGFDVMQDLQYVLGLSLRGNWANEGKILVMMDGVPFNELLYQSVAVGNRFPIDAIERIEIIRGPGSAIYGGSAEYGVINIITTAAESLHGAGVFVSTGFHSNAVGRMNGGVMVGQKKENLAWDVSAFKGKGIVSDQILESYDLSKATYSDPLNINAGIKYKGFKVRSMYDQFETADPFSDVSFKTAFVQAEYEISLSEKFKLTPKLQYLNQIPWYYDYHIEGEDSSDPDFEYRATRMLGQLDANYSISRRASLNFGGVYFKDKSKDLVANEELLTLNNFAIYTQALFKHRLANATVGFRFEKNNRYTGTFVPRIALTKKIENFHFKVLYSKSFRSPSLQNVLLDTTGAKPEKSNVFELELGYQFTPEMLFAINAFHITTKDIIIYGSEGDGDSFEEWYENYQKSGSKGFEVIYSVKKEKWYAHLTYSYSHSISGNTVEKYSVPQTNSHYVGIPASKVTLNSHYQLLPTLGVNTSIIWSSKRYAYTTFDDNGPVSTALTPYALWNVFLRYKPIFLKGLAIGAGVYDILNEKPPIPQAYNGESGAYMPVPGRSREFVFKLSYPIDFKK
jgi:outer membrane receptor for ferrienterochelin and colicin